MNSSTFILILGKIHSFWLKGKQIIPLILLCLASIFLTHCHFHKSFQNPLGEVLQSEDNLFSQEKADLGELLFFDKRLSKDESVSCATCHKPGLAFSDGEETSTGAFGRKTERNSPSILNAGYLPKLMFDGELSTLEMQAIVPIQEHVEMNMDMKELIYKLRLFPEYQDAAKKLFGRDFDPYVLTRSLGAYQRTLISNNSPFDQFYYQGKKRAISVSAKKGFELFSEKLKCTNCHALPHFTTFKVENNGFTPYSDKDQGRFRINYDSLDYGKFKVPSLRNVSVTGPYMHNGKIATLGEIITIYSKGGKESFNKSKFIKAFAISETEKENLIEFLHSLEDY
jgi:cytochrome c peroxidase